MTIQNGLEIARVVLGAIGVYYLYLEVRKSHRVEELKKLVDDFKDKITLEELEVLKLNNPRQYIYEIQHQFIGAKDDNAKRYVNILSDAEVQFQIDNGFDLIAKTISKQNEWLKELDKLNSIHSLDMRKRDLRYGMGFTILAIIIDLSLRLL